MCALLHTVPSFETTVDPDVIYATAVGYRTEAPVDVKGTIFRLLLHQGKPHPVSLEMDIYRPEGDGEAGRPLLLMMHGGSYFIGNKAEAGQAGWCRFFASLGYVAVSIDYRLGFRLTKKDIRGAETRALEDAEKALSFLLGREDLRIDRERIFASGTSAGAVTALHLAFDEERKYPIRAVANLWGSVHDLSVLERANVPILSFQSEKDPVMPYDGGYPFPSISLISRLFSEKMYGTHAVYEKALSLGYRAEHHPCAEKRHRLHLDDAGNYTSRFYEIRDAMAKFFAEEMREPEATSAPESL